MKIQKLSQEINDVLAVHANKERAEQQQRYMKSHMPYFGIPMPQVRRLALPLLKQGGPIDAGQYRETILHLIKHATHREQWYVAVQYARRHTQYITQDSLDTYLEMVRLTQWWDVVDVVAAHLVGDVLYTNRNREHYLTAWIKDENMWIRRVALIAQLRHKELTDAVLLAKLILTVEHEKEFFIRKAIGWALRQYSYTNPQFVINFVEQHKDQLSRLSTREALKGIKRQQS